MINAVIIEDEKATQEQLLGALKEVSPDIYVRAILTTVKQSIQYFRKNLLIDIILCNVQLPDGLSFEIFNDISLKIPVIFIGSYDTFILYAFENNGIDYLLKPVNKQDLERALYKYKMLQKHFVVQNLSDNLKHPQNIKKKMRVLVKKGIENISVRLEEIIMFYTENKIVYVIDINAQKFVIDKTLNELEHELDGSVFFRANRQYIINLAFVKSYKPYEKVKLQVGLHIHEKINHSIIISQDTAPGFRKWISEA